MDTPDEQPTLPSSVFPSRSTPDTARGWHTRGYLPHFDSNHVIQFITWRLADSLPAPVLQRLEQELTEMKLTDEQLEIQRYKRLRSLLDRGYGQCWLRRKCCAQILHDCLLFQHEQHYMLHAFTIMPNHVHVLAHFLPGYDMGKVVGAWKDATAHHINDAVRRQGQLWQEDYWDRFIRDGEHYDNTMRYIKLNPIRAGLVKNLGKWKWTWVAGQ